MALHPDGVSFLPIKSNNIRLCWNAILFGCVFAEGGKILTGELILLTVTCHKAGAASASRGKSDIALRRWRSDRFPDRGL